MAVNILDKLRELIGAAEAEVDEVDPEDDPEVEADAVEGDEPEVEVEGDEPEVEGEGDEPEVEGDEPEVEGDESVTEVDDTETAELRQTILDQAAEIETLRNRVAELGGEVDEVDEVDETEPDETDENVVEAFDSDYAERKARLAEITEMRI